MNGKLERIRGFFAIMSSVLYVQLFCNCGMLKHVKSLLWSRSQFHMLLPTTKTLTQFSIYHDDTYPTLISLWCINLIRSLSGMRHFHNAQLKADTNFLHYSYLMQFIVILILSFTVCTLRINWNYHYRFE